MKEMRVKGSYQHHKQIEGAIGVKLAANNLESALAGTQLYVLGGQDSEEELRDMVENEMSSVLEGVDKTADGVCVQASTLGSLEALLEFLASDAVQIPVCGVNIGPISKKDVMRASMMATRGMPEFAVILAFDIEVKKDARELAKETGVKIMTADIIYHLFDQFSAYMEEVRERKKRESLAQAAFPCVLRILPSCVFARKDPIVVGVDIVDGIARLGTPICVPSQGMITLGRIASIERDHKAVDRATRGQSVAMKIEPTNPTERSRLYGRHFDHRDELVSVITRESINLLKNHFKDELGKEDWRLVVKLKKVFEIQ
jgi:translation initiation factor 5B